VARALWDERAFVLTGWKMGICAEKSINLDLIYRELNNTGAWLVYCTKV